MDARLREGIPYLWVSRLRNTHPLHKSQRTGHPAVTEISCPYASGFGISSEIAFRSVFFRKK